MKVNRLWWFSKKFIIVFIFSLNFYSTFDTVVLAEEIPENQTVAESLKEKENQRDDKVSQIENDLEEQPLELQEESSLIWSFVKLIGALAFVIFIMFFLLKLFNNRSRAFRANKTIENIGGVSLGANRSVQIVRIGERVLVLGVGENVQLIKEIDKNEEVEQLLEKYEQELEKLDVPITKLSNWFKEKTSNPKKGSGKREVEFGTMLKKQLEDVSESQKKVHEAMKEQKR